MLNQKICCFCKFEFNLGYRYWIFVSAGSEPHTIARTGVGQKTEEERKVKGRKWFELSLQNAFGISAMERALNRATKFYIKLMRGYFQKLSLHFFSFFSLLQLLLTLYLKNATLVDQEYRYLWLERGVMRGISTNALSNSSWFFFHSQIIFQLVFGSMHKLKNLLKFIIHLRCD